MLICPECGSDNLIIGILCNLCGETYEIKAIDLRKELGEHENFHIEEGEKWNEWRHENEKFFLKKRWSDGSLKMTRAVELFEIKLFRISRRLGWKWVNFRYQFMR